jgi:hypothetical protein
MVEAPGIQEAKDSRGGLGIDLVHGLNHVHLTFELTGFYGA